MWTITPMREGNPGGVSLESGRTSLHADQTTLGESSSSGL